ncbi:hypothetical protein [Sanguibacter sp. HDW7]|uniref:hypothetical protein n=1 Tax=Sanguibacter sp. HDW7 TaxID=2714931 RepID=UPI00140798C5|nr:hypothetical protein [Sanguibacter sp. HDW7]QIK82386.1 hypothetical protein G7063_01240 [Sanguibacter sp. HDW7]
MTYDPGLGALEDTLSPGTRAHTSAEPVPVTLARLEGKVDTALATQTGRLDGHEQRIGTAETRLNAHSEQLAEQAQRLAAIPAAPPRTSPWTIVATIISAVVGLGSLLGVGIVLIKVVAQIP